MMQRTNSPNYTRNQHFIPQFILKSFTAEKAKNGHLFQYRKVDGDISQKRTEKVACAPHLYSVEMKTGRDDFIEKQFSEIESNASSVIESIISQKKLPNEHELIRSLFLFAALSMIRVKSNVALFEDKKEQKNAIAEAKETFFHSVVHLKELNEFEAAYSSQRGFLFAQLAPCLWYERANGLLKYFGLRLLLIEEGYFILSDRFLTIDWGETSLNKLQFCDAPLDCIARIFMPISSNLCLLFEKRKTPAPLISGDNSTKIENMAYAPRPVYLTEESRDYINRMAVRDSDQYLYCEDEATLRHFTRKPPPLLSRHMQRLSGTSLFS